MDLKRQFGVEIEHGNRSGYVSVGEQVRKKFPKWTNCGSDGSGVELRSPILKGQGGLDELGEVMEFLKSIGGYVTKSDGMHVHHDASDFVSRRFSPESLYYSQPASTVWDGYRYKVVTPSEPKRPEAVKAAAARVLRVLESYAENQPVIDKLVDPYRRGWSKFEKKQLDQWKKTSTVATGRKNVHYTLEHGTFEFRQFEGCLDPVKALAWIEFGQHFLNYTKELTRHASCAASAEGLLKRVGVRAEYQRVLLDRPRTTRMPDNVPAGL